MFGTGTTAAVVALSTVIAAPVAHPSVSNEARALAALVNKTRASAGLPPLTFSAPLSAVAQKYAKRMASGRAPFEHNPALWQQLPAGWVAAGENIAYQSWGSVTDLHRQWLRSPAHYANMMRGYDNVGIGYAVSPTGVVYAVQVFGLYRAALRPVSDMT